MSGSRVCGLRLSVLLLVVGSMAGVSSLDCTNPSSAMVTGSTFEVTLVAGCGRPVIKQSNVTYAGPDLWLVANTTVTFQLTATLAVYGFGVSLSSTSPGDPLGLTPTWASLSAGSCHVYPNATDVYNNTIAHDINNAQPCIVTWTVPPITNPPTNYYYSMQSPTAGVPLVSSQIHIVSASSASSSSSSSSSSSTGTSSSSGAASSSSSSPSATSASSAGSSSASTGTGSGTGTSSNPTPTPTPTSGTGSSSSSRPGSVSSTGTGSSSSSSPTGTSSPSSSSSAPNGAGARVNNASVAAAVAVMWSVLSAYWL